jgi:alkanesulfonate monooxygenase SsuD/methylene tetrahydromethanopterin reductase-like flavin-dependent oxidoreductase (luciferase family)
MVLRDPLPWTQCLQVVRTAEDTGYEAVFVPEIQAREAFATLSGFAGATSRMKLGTGVVSVWARAPATTAMGAATVQELSGGRVLLGLGWGSGPPEGQPTIRQTPVRSVRDYVRALREAFSGRRTEGDGQLGTAGFRLHIPAAAPPPPIWLAALGDRMVGLAGEVADGVILNWCTPQRVAEARAVLDEVAGGAGRNPGDLTLSVYVRACLGVDEGVALRALGAAAGQYASFPQYRRQMDRMGLGPAAGVAARAYREGRLEEVPEELIRALTVTGGRDAALARFAEYRRAGADLVLCYPVPALEPLSSILGSLLAAAPSPAVER